MQRRPGSGPGPNVEDTEEVQMISINDFTVENGISFLDILKIDAEGNDDKVSLKDRAEGKKATGYLTASCCIPECHVFKI